MTEEKYPIFIINLKRSTERRKSMENQMRKFNKRFEFVEAVDGHKLSDSEIFSLCINRKKNKKNPDGAGMYHKRLPKNGVGTYLSHVKVWKHICEKKSPTLLF